MPHQAICRLAFLTGVAVVFGATGAQAGQQYVYYSDGYSGPVETYQPTPANNYVSGNSQYANPYQAAPAPVYPAIPAATMSNQPISVPGTPRYRDAYQPSGPAIPSSSSYPSVSVPGKPQVQGAYQEPASAPGVGYSEGPRSAAPDLTPAPVIAGAPDQTMQGGTGANFVSGNSQYQDASPAPAASYEVASNASPTPMAQPVSQYQPVSGSGISELPSYSYDPNLDPRQLPPYKAPTAEQNNPATRYHPYMGLETRSGIELGGQFFYYSYAEPSLSVTETGWPIELTTRATAAFGDGFFATADLDYMFGDVDYSGTGNINGEGIDSWELRGLFGKDFTVSREYSLSPYIGLGYRTLFNDNRGVTSTGAAGYRRYNELYYIPIGIYPRTHIDSNARLTSTLEFDYVLHGLQTTYLSDDNLGDPNIKNVQSSGYGIRGDIMYEMSGWAFGPFFNYWSIDQSKTKLAVDNSPSTCSSVGGAPCIISVDEPANDTLEVGVQFKYHFF